MSAARHERVKALFLAARDLGASDRTRLLAQACQGDVDLRAGVESLLAHHDLMIDEGGGRARDANAFEGDVAPRDKPHAERTPHAGSRILGDFRINREIGRGGMGVVYEAEQLSLRRTVALKVLPAHLTLQPSAIDRFRREAETAAKLKHPSIVQVHAVGSDAGTHFFAMEFVQGSPLEKVIERLKGKPFETLDGETVRAAVVQEAHHPQATSRVDSPSSPPPPSSLWRRGFVDTVVDLVARVADALEHAHRVGVIHRDVKPSNILVREDGTPVLTDFGLAREQGLPAMTATGEFAGTPYYVSPEQAMAQRVHVDHRTDVYSLGVTLYELLARRRPFEGKTSQEVFRQIIAKEPPNPQRMNPRLASDLVTIVLKAIDKDADRRYQTGVATPGRRASSLER
jgi:serine/threonine protein kinase